MNEIISATVAGLRGPGLTGADRAYLEEQVQLAEAARSDAAAIVDAAPQALLPNVYGYVLVQTAPDGTVLYAEDGFGTQYHSWGTRSPLLANPYGYISADVDADGNVISATLRDGTVVQAGAVSAPDDISRPVAYLDAGVGKYADGRGEIVLDLPPATNYVEAHAGRVEFVSAFQGAPRKYRQLPSGECRVAEPFGVLTHSIGYGQSNSVGAYAKLTEIGLVQPFPSYALMFNGGVTPANRWTPTPVDPAKLVSLVPLHESSVFATQPHGETPGAAMLRQLNATIFYRVGTYQQTLFTACGVSSQPYATLKKATIAYANLIACVTAAKAIADAAGQLYAVSAIHLTHGEGDALDADYGAHLIQLQADLDTDIRAISGQPAPVHLILDQFSAPNFDGSDCTPGMLRSPYLQDSVSAASQVIHLTGPKYMMGYIKETDPQVGDTTGIHLTAAGHDLNGAYHGKVERRVVNDRRKWYALGQRTTIVRTGGVIDITFQDHVGPLVLDTVTVADPGAYGFEYFDASGSPPAIQSVALKPGSDDTVRITLAADPGASAGKRLRYGYSFVANAGGGPTRGPRGCLRDSDPETAAWDDTSHLWNWCIHFDKQF